MNKTSIFTLPFHKYSMFAVDFYALLPFKLRCDVVLTHTAEPLFPNTITVKKKKLTFLILHMPLKHST